LDEQILTFDIPDGALEQAANAEQAYTLAYCTHLGSHPAMELLPTVLV
jgi:hypothetical protein